MKKINVLNKKYKFMDGEKDVIKETLGKDGVFELEQVTKLKSRC